METVHIWVECALVSTTKKITRHASIGCNWQELAWLAKTESLHVAQKCLMTQNPQ